MMPARPVLLAFAAAAVAVAVAAAAATLWLASASTANTVVLSAGTEGGTYAAFAKVFAATRHDEAPAITVLPSAGATENAARLARGEADFGIVQSDTPLGTDVLVVARLFPEAFHLVVRADSGIASVNDLPGARVGLLPEGAGSNALFDRLIVHHEIDPAQIERVHAPLRELEATIARGEIDAFFVVIALGNETIARIIRTTDTRLVPIAQADAMAMFDPALEATIVPVGAYSGQRPVPAVPTPVVSVTGLLAAREDLPDATVEAVVRRLFESRQEMVRTTPQAAFVAAPTDADRLAFGIHPGAELYYGEDDPLFVVEYAEPLALGVTALALLLSALWQVRVWLAGARKNRADHYNLELVEIIARIEAAAGPQELEAVRRDLFEIFAKVIVDLDNDRIEERSLQSFSFAWQVAASTLNHRQLFAAGAAPGRPSASEPVPPQPVPSQRSPSQPSPLQPAPSSPSQEPEPVPAGSP